MRFPQITLPDVALFAHIACRPEAELDLSQAALMLAEPEYPGLDIEGYLQVLGELGAGARGRVKGISDPTERGIVLVQHLLSEEHFRGNVENYEDPRNSFLNEVLDRRLGIPITLSVVMIEVARRAGVPLQGVSFPGHFLLRAGAKEGSPTFIDPFSGRVLAMGALGELLKRMTGEARELGPASPELQVAGKGAILVRMLNNLRSIYTRAGDSRRLHLVLERLRVLEQGPSLPFRSSAGSA